MSVNPLNTSNSDAANFNEVNKLIREVQALETTQIFKDDAGIRRVLLGRGPNGFYGLKVSEEGEDVYEATDDQLVFNSSQNMFKIRQRGTATIPSFVSTSGYSSVTIPHGQSFTPIVEVYARGNIVDATVTVISASYVPLPINFNAVALAGNYYFENSGGGSYRPLALVFAVDATNIYIQASSDATLGAFTFADIPVTYYILQETAN